MGKYIYAILYFYLYIIKSSNISKGEHVIMKQFLKKFFALALALCMLLCMMPESGLSAFASTQEVVALRKRQRESKK